MCHRSAVDPAVRMALTRTGVVKKYLHGTSDKLCIPYLLNIADFIFVVNIFLNFF